MLVLATGEVTFVLRASLLDSGLANFLKRAISFLGIHESRVVYHDARVMHRHICH